MRTEGAIFFRDSDFGQRFVNCSGQVNERVLRFDSDPKDTGCFGSRKKASAAESKLEWLAADRAEGFYNLRHLRVWFLANEFQSHMQRFTAYPAHVGRCVTNLIHKILNSLPNCRIQLERDEDPHATVEHSKLASACITIK
jgi:hypothetical protein